MRSSIFSLLALSLMTCGSLFAADDNAGSFPPEVSFTGPGGEYKLQQTGVSVRKKFFVKVYTIASYVQDAAKFKGPDRFQGILESNNAKQLTMKWVHDATAQQVREGYHESFKKTLSEGDQAQLKSQIDQYIAFFQSDAKVGDEYVLRWFPGGQIQVRINGKLAGDLTNNDFAKALWGIWLGERSVVDREALTAQLK